MIHRMRRLFAYSCIASVSIIVLCWAGAIWFDRSIPVISSEDLKNYTPMPPVSTSTSQNAWLDDDGSRDYDFDIGAANYSLDSINDDDADNVDYELILSSLEMDADNSMDRTIEIANQLGIDGNSLASAIENIADGLTIEDWLNFKPTSDPNDAIRFLERHNLDISQFQIEDSSE